MSKQFRVYLLPSDVERMVERINSAVGVKVYRNLTEEPALSELSFSDERLVEESGAQIYLAPSKDAQIKLRLITTRSLWVIETESEVIEFSTCGWNGNFFREGRLYFQMDMLIDDTIWRKRQEFLQWADRAFRAAKRTLHYSKIWQHTAAPKQRRELRAVVNTVPFT